MPKPKPITFPAGDSSLKPFVSWFLDTDQFTDADRVKFLSSAVTTNAWNLCGQLRMFKIEQMPSGKFILILTPEGANDILSGMPEYRALPVQEQFLATMEVVRGFARFSMDKSVNEIVAGLLRGRRIEADATGIVGRSPCTDYSEWICRRIVSDIASASDEKKAFEVDAFDADGNPQYALTSEGIATLCPNKTRRKSTLS